MGESIFFIILNVISGEQIYDQMISAFYEVTTLSYKSEGITYYEGRKDTEMFSYEAMLKKPDYAKIISKYGFIVSNSENTYISIYGPSSPEEAMSIYCDTVCYIGQNTYFKLHSVPSLGHQLVLIGGGFPELNPSLFMGIKDWSPKLIDSIILKCTEIVEGDTLYLIEMSMMEGQRVREIWVSKKDWLPRKIIRTVKVASPLITEEVWSEIKINQDITDDSFNWKPTKEWKEEDSRIITGDKTLPKNSVAPPFSFLSIDGDTISLSDFKGKVLWLCFWRVGCPPCRTGMPYIQKIYEKLKSKGLCVLGFNCADDKEIVIKYFEKNKITFPNILDNSEEARKTGQKYYNNKVPLHYIIDRDGKIFDTYIGYDGKEYQEIEKILEQLDVK